MTAYRVKGSFPALLLNKKRNDAYSPIDEHDPIKKEKLEHIQRIEKACSGTIKSAGIYYDTNRKINLIIVTVGVVLLANSIAYTWYKQTPDAWSVFSGGLGISLFVTLFFTNCVDS
jgi:hypothetical protein